MPAVVVDVDGTLLKKDGSINHAVVRYIKRRYKEIIVMTNRNGNRRESTLRQLKDMGIDKSYLFMNSTDPKIPAPAWKKKMVKFLLSKGHHIVEFIDDRKENRDAVESIGYIKVTDPAQI